MLALKYSHTPIYMPTIQRECEQIITAHLTGSQRSQLTSAGLTAAAQYSQYTLYTLYCMLGITLNAL